MSEELDKWFMISWRKLWFIVVSGFVAVMIHNFGSALLTHLLGYEFEEPVFFIYVVIVLPIYVLISLVYSLVKIIRKKKKLSIDALVSGVVGLAGGYLVVSRLGWEGPWFFGLFSLLVAAVVYSLIRFLKKS